MARLCLHFDEHVQASLAQGLRARGVDALTTQEAGDSSLDDEGQLRFAAAQGRALLSYNKRSKTKLASWWPKAKRWLNSPSAILKNYNNRPFEEASSSKGFAIPSS